MKNVKLIIFGIIIALLVVFAFQNQENYFQKKNHFKLDLIVAGPYQTAEISNTVICIVTFVSGIIVFYLLTLFGRIKRRKSIKELNNSLNDRQNEIASLKRELDAPKASTSGQIPPDNVKLSQEGKENAAATL